MDNNGFTEEKDQVMKRSGHLGLFALVLGVVGFLTCALPVIGLPALLIVPAAIVLGVCDAVKARREARGCGMGVAGAVLGLLSVGGLIVQLAVTLVVALVFYPNYMIYREVSQKQACISNMKMLQCAGESWLTANPGTTVPTLEQLCGPEPTKYLRNVPTCPKGGAPYKITLEDGAINVTCEHHGLEP